MTPSANRRLVIVLTTLGANADASQFARALVEEGLAACVSLVPGLRSIYRWKDAVETDEEQQLVIKTRADLVPALEESFRSLHPYELPEFLVIEASASDAYARWVDDSCRPAARTKTASD